MASEKVETIVAGNYMEMEHEPGGGGDHDQQPSGGAASSTSSSSRGGRKKKALSSLFWHGGSVYDAWFSCASNQVAQVLLTLPYSFSQLGMASGVVFQLFYGLMGSWTAYLISILYVEYRTRKEREKVDFRNHVIQVRVSCVYIYDYLLAILVFCLFQILV
jgi:auxin influx carrier (AUX1 LAX family)